jgi:cytochrome c-type biogenesis protein CcmH
MFTKRKSYLLVKRILIYCSLLVILFPSSLSFAQVPTPEAPTDDQVNSIARQIYCPICENTPLDVCPTQACAEWRELIREKLAEGWSEKQIIQHFVDRFGERVLAVPPPRGLNWLIYMVPSFAFIFGIILFYRYSITWRKSKTQDFSSERTETKNSISSATDSDYINRIEDELQSF